MILLRSGRHLKKLSAGDLPRIRGSAGFACGGGDASRRDTSVARLSGGLVGLMPGEGALKPH